MYLKLNPTNTKIELQNHYNYQYNIPLPPRQTVLQIFPINMSQNRKKDNITLSRYYYKTLMEPAVRNIQVLCPFKSIAYLYLECVLKFILASIFQTFYYEFWDDFFKIKNLIYVNSLAIRHNVRN